MDKVKTNPCRIAIQKTLAYTSVFKYPLSFYQLTNGMITQYRFSNKQIRTELKKQEEEKLIDKVKDKNNKSNKYILHGIKQVDLDERKQNTLKIFENNKEVLNILRKIPWILMIAVTGSAANYNSDEKADIDLLFIVKKDRVWITRGFVFILLSVLNKLPKDHKERELCPNIFIDETSLSWIKKRRNLYIAQNIISMQPIFNKSDTYFKFMYANRWVTSYYHNFKINYPDNFIQSVYSRSFLMRLIELVAMKLQVMYMRRKRTTEIATSKLIHFNKNDNSRWILKSYKNLLRGEL